MFGTHVTLRRRTVVHQGDQMNIGACILCELHQQRISNELIVDDNHHGPSTLRFCNAIIYIIIYIYIIYINLREVNMK